MAYNLPPAWNAGFALPDNVRDEGLERRAFVTKWMPRGTYDQPAVGTGGYVVPDYVMDEGYGQGTFTTKWEPRGQYDIPVERRLNVRPKLVGQERFANGKRVLQIAVPPGASRAAPTTSAMGGIPAPTSFADYGDKAASAIISSIAQVAPSQRAKQLRKVMDKIDRTLWKRTQDITKTLVAQGQPTGVAFRAGLSRALAAGMTSELINTGKAGSVTPQLGSLLGLGDAQGLRGAIRQALGRLPIGLTATPTTSPNPTSTAGGGETIDYKYNKTAVVCPGFSWVPQATSPYGYWQRTMAGKADAPMPAGTINGALATCGVIRVHAAACTGTEEECAAQAQGAQATADAGPKKKTMMVGPWRFPAEGEAFIRSHLSTVTGDQKKAIIDALNLLSKNVTVIVSGMTGGFGGPATVKLEEVFPQLGITGRVPYTVFTESAGQNVPFLKFKHPTDKEDWPWGLYLRNVSPDSFDIVMKKIDKGWLDQFLQFIGEVIAFVEDVVDHVVHLVETLGCGLVNQPNSTAAGTAAGGPEVGIGVEVAKAACGQPPQQTAPQPETSYVVPLAIGGAALVAIILLTSKKKKKATS